MEHKLSYIDDFKVVWTFVVSDPKLDHETHLSLSHKITRKIRKYNHSHTTDDFKHIYIKYYLYGIYDQLGFNEIIKDGAFHKFDYDMCKSFFLEVYDDNRYLMKQFELNNYNYFKNNQEHTEYKKWLEDNFKKAFNNINNINKVNNVSKVSKEIDNADTIKM